MIDDNSQNDTSGQGSMDSETEQRNRENETGQQSETPTSNADQGGEPQFGQPQSGQQQSGQPEFGQSQGGQTQGGQSGGESGTGFVGSGGDESSDYLTKGENQDFQPEGQGATDTGAGTSDIETDRSNDDQSGSSF